MDTKVELFYLLMRIADTASTVKYAKKHDLSVLQCTLIVMDIGTVKKKVWQQWLSIFFLFFVKIKKKWKRESKKKVMWILN